MNSVTLDNNAIYPSKIVCVGRNYLAHIEELANETPEEPVIFIKPNSSIANDICFDSKDAIHYEGEISFLIQSGELYAVGFGMDLTKRDIQSRLKASGLPWERAKSFDKSAVFSKFVRFDGKLSDLRMELQQNGDIVQQAGYDLMLHKPVDILNEVSSFITLEDGDILMTGTPKGVGTINIGDLFSGKIFNNDELLLEASWQVK
jgi:2-keto-4-pentenoate hydratase/2-oxohepta-3-ene-1,7-dioic acid hydratase in catechol pathway